MKTKTKRNSRQRTYVDVRSLSDVKPFELLVKGGITLTIVTKKGCPYCENRDGEFKSLMNKSGPHMNVARIDASILPHTSLSNVKVDGYPSAILVDNNGVVSNFTRPDGTVTNALPKSDTKTLNDIVNGSKQISLPTSLSASGIPLPPPTPYPMSNNSNNSINSIRSMNSINSTQSNSLIPSTQPSGQFSKPPDVLSDLIETQQKRPAMEGGKRKSIGLFKELELMYASTRNKIQQFTKKVGKVAKKMRA